MTQYTLAEAVAERSVFAHLAVTTQTNDTATLVKRKNPRNGMNGFLTLITFGLWAPIWIFCALFTKDQHEVLRVDGDGVIQHTRQTAFGRTVTHPYQGRSVESRVTAIAPY